MMLALIIDDEPLARELIKSFLKDYDQIQLAGECSDGFDGIKAIQEKQPDLVFLDVQMPRINGFEMLELIEDPPAIVFTTAYNEYAIKAFEMNAVDYLLKPFSKDRFRQALERVISSRNAKELTIQNLIALQNDPSPVTELLQRIVVKTGNKIQILPVSEVIYLEAQDDYVMIYNSGGKYLKQQTMKYFEKVLDNHLFVRIHRSYLVNVNYIALLEQYDKESFKLLLKDKRVLPVSKSGYVELKKILGI